MTESTEGVDMLRGPQRQQEEPWTPARVALTLADAGDLLAPMLEAVAGYRASCEAAGFSPTAAEFMALQYHAMLLGQQIPQAAT